MTETNETLQSYREDLHRIPELGFELPKTLTYVKKHLETLNGEVFEPAPSSLCIYFDAGSDTTIALRADMDGLPVKEETGNSFESTHPGQMHACGHDGHMAMLLAACDYVSENAERLPHNVLAIFQPAEETVGGAEPICASGVLQKYGVNAVFGLHMWPGYPAGTIVSRPGELMARSSEITVDVVGKSVHIAKSAEGRDAMLAAAQLVETIHGRVAEIPAEVHRLLAFGLLRAGTVRNALAGRAHLEGTMRAFSDETYDELKDILLTSSALVEERTGCDVNVDITAGYPAVYNDSDLFSLVKDQVNTPIVTIDEPQMTGEDFSFYQREVPGVFYFVGTGFEHALHSSQFDLQPEALIAGTEFLKSLLTVNLSELERNE